MHGRYVSRSLQSYNQQAIEAWKAEVNNIPLEIEQIRTRISTHQEQLNLLEPQLQQLKAEKITPLEKQILLLQSQYNVLTIPGQTRELQSEMIPHSDQLKIIQPQLAEEKSAIVVLDAEINRLNILIEIRVSKEAEGRLLSEIDTNLQEVGRLQKVLHEVQSRELEIKTAISVRRTNLAAARINARFSPHMNNVHRGDVYNRRQSHGYHNHPAHTAMSDAIAELDNEIRELEQKRSSCASSISELDSKIASHQTKVDEARRRLDEHKRRMIFLEQQVQGYSSFDNLSLLRANLDARLKERRPHEARRVAFESDYNQNKRQVERLQREILQLGFEYERSNSMSHEFAANQNITGLSTQLQEKQASRSEIGEEETRLKNAIAATKQAITDADELINTKTSRLNTLLDDKFMIDLRDHPDLLITNFEKLVHASFENYEETHPVNQPVNIRLCLAETINKLNAIVNLPKNSDQKQKYYQLCGMLWEMLDKADGGTDLDLAEQIMEIFSKHPVDPDEAKTAYQSMRLQHPSFPGSLEWSDFISLQRTVYDEARSKLDSELCKLPYMGSTPLAELRKHGFELLNSIYDLKQEAETQDDQKYDVKYYTRVLNITAALVSNPGHSQLRQKYHKLIEVNTDGKPSPTKKISGSMLMLLSASVIAAKFAIARFPARVSAPIVLASSGLAFLLGAGLFGSGMQKGTSKKMAKFEKAASQAGAVPPSRPRSGPS